MAATEPFWPNNARLAVSFSLIVTRHLGVRIQNSVLEKDILPDNIIR
jgi:hypothetical protein